MAVFAGSRMDPRKTMRTVLSMRRLRSALVLVAACGALAGFGLRPIDRAERPLSQAERIVAGLEATSAREARPVEPKVSVTGAAIIAP